MSRLSRRGGRSSGDARQGSPDTAPRPGRAGVPDPPAGAAWPPTPQPVWPPGLLDRPGPVKVDVPDPAGAGHVRVALFGTPGQQRVSFMWRILSEGMRAFVVLVDASRQHSRDQAREILTTFRATAPEAPFVVAVNRWDESDDVDRMVLSLGLRASDVPRLVRADVRDHDTGIALLQLALQQVRPLPAAG